jgi:hypothetical protein
MQGIEDSFAKGNNSIPLKYFDYDLMMEWGISYQEFMDTPALVIEEMTAFIGAKERGRERQRKMQTNKNKLKNMRNGR